MKVGVKNFTIVELLIVIVILAILISMLLPALNAAYNKVKDASCNNNLRQIGLSLQLYCADNDERFPDYGAIGARDAANIEYPNANYRRGLGENDGGGPEIYGVAAAVVPYLGNKWNIWICPSATPLKQSYKNTYSWYARSFQCLSISKGMSFRTSAVTAVKLSKTPILFDNITYAPIATGKIATAVGLATLPSTAANETIGPHRKSDPYARLSKTWAGVHGLSATGYVCFWNTMYSE